MHASKAEYNNEREDNMKSEDLTLICILIFAILFIILLGAGLFG